MTADQIERIKTALFMLTQFGIDARVQNLYNAAGEPSIVIVVPGVVLEDGRLKAAV